VGADRLQFDMAVVTSTTVSEASPPDSSSVAFKESSRRNLHLEGISSSSLVTAESLPYRDTKGESREAVLLALVVTDLHIKKLPPFTSCGKYYLVTGAFPPTERAIWERVLASPSRRMAGEESVKKPPSKVFKGRGDSWAALDSI